MPLCLHLRNYVYEKKRICNLDIQWLAALPLPSTVSFNPYLIPDDKQLSKKNIDL